jgi:hypothetical protein
MNKRKEGTLEGSFQNSKNRVSVNLSVLAFKDDDSFIVYSPALDLSGYGDTEQEAEQSFQESLSAFLDYSTNKGTLEKELIRLGWKISGKAKKRVLTPPELDELLRDNEMLSTIVKEKDFSKKNERLEIPAFA